MYLWLVDYYFIPINIRDPLDKHFEACFIFSGLLITRLINPIQGGLWLDHIKGGCVILHTPI